MTPMIDIIFLLIVFFVMVSQVIDKDNVDIEIPKINNSVASKIDNSKDITLNLFMQEDGRCTIDIFGVLVDIENIKRLRSILSKRFDVDKTKINIRAERTMSYIYVYKVLDFLETLEGVTELGLVIKDEGL